jgi:glycosidase
MGDCSGGPREFHVSRRARDRYAFDEALFGLSGNLIFANFHAARVFAQKMNDRRDVARFPERVVRAGQINAMGLIDEILHYVVGLFREQKSPTLLPDALRWLEEHIGVEELDRALGEFLDEFPPVALYRGGGDPAEYLKGRSAGTPNRQILQEEMLLLWLANLNPAFHPYRELFDDSRLEKNGAYRRIMASLHEFFDTQPTFGPWQQNLMDMLRSPALAHPHSLSDQLEYIRRHWGYLLGKYLFRLLSSLDLIREENKLSFAGPGLVQAYEYGGLDLEMEAFSQDRDWMPRVVMIAKTTSVWLDQLAKQFRRPITTLDQVPDEELDRLARAGFTALWLIGLWERSRASKRIKQMCGNPEAEASAYSLLGYEIAADLGGWEAFQKLKGRAWQRGIRMAGDMVPNHMGIDSQWVMEHPDWFIGLDHSPFPSYRFGGADLSWRGEVGIQLEDHYYSRTDAAVVFKRSDRSSGGERYIYHGNDGTSMPWNDTAQLDFLKPEVREAVIQTILHVARSFPIIRFDAAMTLTRRHYQRLWYPEPGTGGDIPSRAGQGLPRPEFERAMPREFWREVVDRVAREVPDTLLLAEAFWLLEGYFVRTLGMHRVYNSAFMNMLKMERNAEYRSVIKNTLEFNPEILKRFVNFMSNPDEETAVAQFGKGDKYLGVCAMMVTLPGLPMFGHGQLEGYTEKYGMEFRRAYWDEHPDEELLRRHAGLIFPLLHRRALFAEVENFLLYDLFTPDGKVNEDVFAYSNQAGSQRALVVYHNRYAETRGWIRTSTAVSLRFGPGEQRSLVRRTLSEGLSLSTGPDDYCLFRDMVSGLEYLRGCRQLQEQGLYVEMRAYQLHVFADFRQVTDRAEEPYAALADYLNGRGVPSMREALRDILLQPLHGPLKQLISAASIARLLPEGEGADPGLLAEVEERLGILLERLREEAHRAGWEASPEAPSSAALAAAIRRKLEACFKLAEAARAADGSPGEGLARGLEALTREQRYGWGSLLAWVFVHGLGGIAGGADCPQRSRSWIDELLLGKLIAGALQGLGLEEGQAWRAVALVKILTAQQGWFQGPGGRAIGAYQVLESLLADTDVQLFLQVHRHEGILWFNKESFDELLGGLQAVAVVDALASAADPRQLSRWIEERRELARRLQSAEDRSGYRVEQLLAWATPAAGGRT